MKRKYYIAYGSNLNVNQMLRRCPDAVKIGASVIEDYKLVFRRGFLTIEPSEGLRVPVGIWAISEMDEELLDVYEGFPRFYVKQFFRLSVNGKTVRAMAYVMTPGHQVSPPSRRYFDVCAEGYVDFGLEIAPLLAALTAAKTESDAEAVARKTVDAYARKQKNGTRYCPRCGGQTIKPCLAANALSRRANIYVCDACGMDEAVRDWMGEPLPFVDWAVVQKRR